MFKKPFDKANGEIRNCKMCQLDFHSMKPVWFCPKCQVIKQTAIRQRKLAEGVIELKAPYPYVKIKDGKREYIGRFKKMQTKLNRMHARDEWKQFFKQRLEEIFNDEVLMKWIFDRRDNETKKAKQTKSKTKTNKEYPDLRGIQID